MQVVAGAAPAVPDLPLRVLERDGLPAAPHDEVVGPLRAAIGRRYTLDEGARARVEFERRHTTGKLVVVR